MTITSQANTTPCPAWCTEHQLNHLPDGRVDADYHLHVVERFGADSGSVEVYEDNDGTAGAYWASDNCSDPDHIRRLGRALIRAADVMHEIKGQALLDDAKRRMLDGDEPLIGYATELRTVLESEDYTLEDLDRIEKKHLGSRHDK